MAPHQARRNQHRDPNSFTYTDLPKDAPPSAKVKLTLIHQGHLKTYRGIMSTDVHEGEATIQQRKDEKLRVPMYGWMIEKDDERYLFDLGMLRDVTKLPEAARKTTSRFGPDIPEGSLLPEQLYNHKPPIDPDSLNGIFLSHCHLDHYGDMNAFSPHVPILVGPGTKEWIDGGDQTEDGVKSFPSRYLENRELQELDGNWQPIGAFRRGLDYFHDGSFWLVQSPGHCPGHIVAIARVTTSPATYILLAGDAAHSSRLYQPAPPPELRSYLGEFDVEDGKTRYMYDDVDTSYDTIGRLTRMHMDEKVMIIAAHEVELEQIIGLKPGEMRAGWDTWKQNGLKERKAPQLAQE